MNDAIFLQRGGRLVPMTERRYDNEALLQAVLAEYPDLIAGLGTAGDRARLLLVRREMPVPDASGANTMSLDHLFVDQDATPVLVEVKRSSDTRLRREVVAQMLDYAANGPAHWPAGRLRSMAEAQLPQERRIGYLAEALGVEDEPDDFWTRVEENLRRGQVRLVFLADRIPPDLVRVIEFLNEQLRVTEVLAIELPQYRGPGIDDVIYVPRMIGATAEAQETKRATRPRAGDSEEAFLTQLSDARGPEGVEVAQALMAVWRDLGHPFRWGSGRVETSNSFAWAEGTRSHTPIVIMPRGTIEVNFQHFTGYPPFDETELEMEFRDRLRAIPGLDVSRVIRDGRPVLPLSEFADRARRQSLAETLRWYDALVREVEAI